MDVTLRAAPTAKPHLQCHGGEWYVNGGSGGDFVMATSWALWRSATVPLRTLYPEFDDHRQWADAATLAYERHRAGG